jgi:hypothetical protein
VVRPQTETHVSDHNPLIMVVLPQVNVFLEGDTMNTVHARRVIASMLAVVTVCTLIYSTHIVAAPNRPATQAPYRIEMAIVLDRDDAKLVKIRVDSGSAFYGREKGKEKRGHCTYSESRMSPFAPSAESLIVDICGHCALDVRVDRLFV